MSALKPSRASSLSAAVVAGVVVTSSFVVPAQAVEPAPDAASATATTDPVSYTHLRAHET